jgi:hypothetical protein
LSQRSIFYVHQEVIEMTRHKRSIRRIEIPFGLLLLVILSFLVGCPGPSRVDEEIASPGLDPSPEASVRGDPIPTSLSGPTAASPVESSEQEIPALSTAARGVESALLNRELEKLVDRAHPRSRDEFMRVFGEVVDEMAEFGRGFAHRRMISLNESQALYSVFVPGFGEYLVEFSRSDATWWLTLWTPF